MSDEHRGGGARDSRHVVVLGPPEARVTPSLRVPREIDGVAERLRRRAPFDDWREIEDGVGNHPFPTLWPPRAGARGSETVDCAPSREPSRMKPSAPISIIDAPTPRLK